MLADEVGLGKTYVAKQVINLIREWHKQEQDDFFKVVYICSNANIADQNIEKLGVDNRMSISESRLSMQHLYIKLAEKRIAKQREKGEMPESIIPLTPSTSFRFYSAQGTANERALMYDILCELPQFKDHKKVISNLLSCNVKNWHELTIIYNGKIKECGKDYLCEMYGKLQTSLSDTIINQLIEYAQNGCDNRQRADLINKLRRIFAGISIDMLDPDLVIMDEFQRFNSLLEQSDDEQSMLANKFFDNKRSNTKILLLSATPYKPYSTLEELNTDGNDEHYQDFMKVMDFLYATKDKTDRFKLIWHTYSAALKRTDVVDLTPLVSAKNEAEEALYGVMCRTERFNSGIIDDSQVCDVQVLPEDILSFAECQHLMDCLSHENKKIHLGNLPMEYVKSSPYLLSFMDKYELKKQIVSALHHLEVKKPGKMKALLLSRDAINKYRSIPFASGKLKYLHDLVFGVRHEKKTHLLLWVPASNPYYTAESVFECNEARSFSKVILFSSWEMVPRMISIMMSYYSDLYTFGELTEPKIGYASKKKNRYGEGRLRTGGLLEYPCRTLAGLFSPAEFYGEKLSSIRRIIKQRIQEKFAQNTLIHTLPQQGRNNAQLILSLMRILDDEPVEDLIGLYVPSNALDVMTDIAIASPAVCAYRQSGNEEDAKMVAKAIVSVFNKPESAVVIDLMYNKKNDDDYYESVLDYCVIGNLQAVLDEYGFNLIIQLIMLFLKNSHIINFHCCRKTAFVNTLKTAPRAAPCKIEYNIERCVERPGVVTGAVIVISKQLLSVNIEHHFLGCPFKSILVEVRISSGNRSTGTLYRCSTVVVLVAMDCRHYNIRIISHRLHYIYLAIARPCCKVDRHHPECRPCALSFRQFDACLDITILPALIAFCIYTCRLDVIAIFIQVYLQCSIRHFGNIIALYITLQLIVHETRTGHFKSPVAAKFSSVKLIIPHKRIAVRSNNLRII